MSAISVVVGNSLSNSGVLVNSDHVRNIVVNQGDMFVLGQTQAPYTAPKSVRFVREGTNLLVFLEDDEQVSFVLENYFAQETAPKIVGLDENGQMREFVLQGENEQYVQPGQETKGTNPIIVGLDENGKMYEVVLKDASDFYVMPEGDVVTGVLGHTPVTTGQEFAFYFDSVPDNFDFSDLLPFMLVAGAGATAAMVASNNKSDDVSDSVLPSTADARLSPMVSEPTKQVLPSDSSSLVLPQILKVFDDVDNAQRSLVDGDYTYDVTPTLTGIAGADSMLTVYVNGQIYGTTEADDFGNWSYAITSALDAGSYVIEVSAQDTSGNETGITDSFTFVVGTPVFGVEHESYADSMLVDEFITQDKVTLDQASFHLDSFVNALPSTHDVTLSDDYGVDSEGVSVSIPTFQSIDNELITLLLNNHGLV